MSDAEWSVLGAELRDWCVRICGFIDDHGNIEPTEGVALFRGLAQLSREGAARFELLELNRTQDLPREALTPRAEAALSAIKQAIAEMRDIGAAEQEVVWHLLGAHLAEMLPGLVTLAEQKGGVFQ